MDFLQVTRDVANHRWHRLQLTLQVKLLPRLVIVPQLFLKRGLLFLGLYRPDKGDQIRFKSWRLGGLLERYPIHERLVRKLRNRLTRAVCEG
jgi:hypothetical protein